MLRSHRNLSLWRPVGLLNDDRADHRDHTSKRSLPNHTTIDRNLHRVVLIQLIVGMSAVSVMHRAVGTGLNRIGKVLIL